MIGGSASFLVGVGDLASGGVVIGDGQHPLVGGDDYRVGGAGVADVLAAHRDLVDAGLGGDGHGTGDRGARRFGHIVMTRRHIAVAVFRRDHRRSVGLAGDRNGQGGSAGRALRVGHGVRDRRRCGLAVIQILECRAGIERVRAVGVERERAAIRTDDRLADVGVGAIDLRNTDGIAVRIAVVAQHAFGNVVNDQGLVFTGGAFVIGGDRDGVAHGPDEGLGDGCARLVGGGDGDEVLALDARVGVIGRPVGELAGEGAGGGVELQAAGDVVDRVDQGVAVVEVAEEAGQVVVDDIAVHVVLVLQGNCGRRVVGAGDFDRQRGGAGAALAVRDGIGDRAGRRLARGQVLEGIAGIERVRAVGIQGERAAVGAGRRRAHVASGAVDLRHGQGVAVRVHVVGQDAVLGADVERGVFVGGAVIIGRRRRRVGDVPVEVLGSRGAGRVGGGHRHRVDAIVAALRGGMVDGAGDDAGVRVDGQAGRQAGGGKGELVAGVRVREMAGDVVAHAGLGVDARGVGDGGGHRAVVGAGDRHDDVRRGGGAAGIRDGVRNGTGGRFAHGQVAVFVTRVEDVAAVGQDREGAAVAAVDRDAGRGHGAAADRDDRQRVAIGIRVVQQQVAAHQAVLFAAAGIVQRVGRGVDGGRSGFIVAAGAGAGQAGQDLLATAGVRVGQVERGGGFQDAGQAHEAAAAGIAAAGHDGSGGIQFIERVAAVAQGGQQAVGVGAGGRSHSRFGRVGQGAGHVAGHGNLAAFADDDRHAVLDLKRNRGARGSDHVAACGDLAALMQFSQGTVAIAYPRATGDFVDDCGRGVGHVGSVSGSYPRWPDTRLRRRRGILSSRTVSGSNFDFGVGGGRYAVDEQGELQAVGYAQLFENG
ncbi:hypothetical protein LMG26852_05342 [Achromobacter aegrifaciens]|nr:hypothetical protein LMG26852_05342 [Achromobacter aegrifaciens]